MHGGYSYCSGYIRRISDTACSPSNEYPSEPRHLAELVCDSRIGCATGPGAPKLITTTPMVLPYQSSEIPVPPKASRNALLVFDWLLKSTLLSFHSASSHTLMEAPSYQNTFCWCWHQRHSMSPCGPYLVTSNISPINEVNTKYNGQCSKKEPFATSRGQIRQIDKPIHTTMSSSEWTQDLLGGTKGPSLRSIVQLAIQNNAWPEGKKGNAHFERWGEKELHRELSG